MKLCQGKFSLNIRKRLITQRVAESFTQVKAVHFYCSTTEHLGSGHRTKPDRIQEVLEQCSQVYGVILGDVLCRARSWILMIILGPFQL